MIRRDFILRQLEQFAAVLARMAGFAKNEQWQEASSISGGEIQRLAGAEPEALLQLSEGALLARLIEGEPAFAVESKILMLVTLLKSEGDLLAGQCKADEGRKFYLKGLHLLFESFGRVDIAERPAFVPTVEAFLSVLRDAPLPMTTNAMLVRHYEQTGDYARAEDALFEMLEAEPGNAELIRFVRMFYQRLLSLDNDALALGNLPRAEVQTGLEELERHRSDLS